MKSVLALFTAAATMTAPTPRLHGPYISSVPVRGETAVCRDGARSISRHHSGTCSSHGGVLRWS